MTQRVPPTPTTPGRPAEVAQDAPCSCTKSSHAALSAPVLAWNGARHATRHDMLAIEEPLEIRLAGYSVAVTMRTPGDDFDLAAGFLFTEGVIRGIDDIASISHCPTDDGDSATNIVNLNPADPTIVDPARWQRNFLVTSSCGICGRASIEDVRRKAPPTNGKAAMPLDSSLRVPYSTLYRLERELQREQTLFRQTGGLHAAALFDLEGRLVVLREDVGRHNAVDKVIGAMLRQKAALPLRNRILLVSSRASFEIVQKALMAGIPLLAAVSAASSLAVALAAEMNMTLVGFLRSDGGGRFNVYTGEEQIVTQVPVA